MSSSEEEWKEERLDGMDSDQINKMAAEMRLEAGQAASSGEEIGDLKACVRRCIE